MKLEINPKYNVGDKVYILNKFFEVAQSEIEGIVVYSNGYSYMVDDTELQEEKVFDSEESCRNDIYKSIKTLFR